MIAVRPLVEERVEQVEDVSVIPFEVFFVGFVFFEGLNPLGMCSILCNFLQDLNLSCLPNNLLNRRRLRGSAGSSSSPLTPHSCRTWSLWPAKRLKNVPSPTFAQARSGLWAPRPHDTGDIYFTRELPSDFVVLNAFVFAVVFIVQFFNQFF